MRLDAARYGIKSIARRALSTWAGAPSRALQFVRQFKLETRDPAWTILDHLHSPIPAKGHAQRALPLAHREWDFLIRAGDIQSCLDALRTRGISLDAVPFWGLAEMVAFNVHRPSHTDTVLEVAQSRAPAEPAGPLLVFAMVHLARFDRFSAFAGTVSAFLGSAHTHPDLHFNLFLQSLCLSSNSSDQVARSVVRVLQAMDDRGVSLRPDVYDVLLRDRFVTLELTKYLHERMVREGHVPTQEQLEGFLRVFSREGVIHDPTAYEKTVKPLLMQNQRKLRYSPRAHAMSRVTGSSAFVYLNRLVNKDDKRSLLTTMHLRDNLSRPERYPLVDLPRIGVVEATTALHALAKDPRIGTKQLLQAHTRATHIRPLQRETVASRTALIVALLRRRAHATAVKHAKRLLRSGLALDARALSAAAQALILAGHPQHAIDVLAKHAGHRGRRPLPTAALNDILAALLAARRPDVLLALVDLMGPVLRAQPDTRTLTLALRAAARGARLDDTLRGALAALRRRLHRAAPAEVETTLAGVRAMAAARYRAGVWRGAAAVETARGVFIGAVLSKAGGRLKDVEAPAVAVRSHRDADSLLLISAHGRPMRTADVAGDALPWPLVANHAARAQTSPDRTAADDTVSVPPSVTSPAQAVAPTPSDPALESAFFAYVCVLGHARRAPEIALTLAWMRALGVRPRARTIAVALALWAEVAMEAPLVQRMSRADEHARLEGWVRAWAKEDGFAVPEARGMWKWRRWVDGQRGE